jgi:hypothetical protein
LVLIPGTCLEFPDPDGYSTYPPQRASSTSSRSANQFEALLSRHLSSLLYPVPVPVDGTVRYVCMCEKAAAAPRPQTEIPHHLISHHPSILTFLSGVFCFLLFFPFPIKNKKNPTLSPSTYRSITTVVVQLLLTDSGCHLTST